MKVRLGDVATYINGYAFKPEDWSDSGLPIIRIQDLTGNSYKTNRFSGKYDKKFEVNDGDILISWSASIGVYIWRGEKAILNQHIFKVKFDKQVNICKKFFIYQVENILKKAILETHGATMKHLTKPVFDSLPFYLPDIKKQNEISAILDKISEIISLRQQQLKKLDELVKSRFIEMFGKAQVNPRNFTIMPWEKVFFTTTGKLDSNAMVEDGQYPFFTCAKEIFKIDTYAFDCEALLLAGNNAAGIYDVKYYKGKFNVYQRTYVLRLTNSRWSYQLFKKQLEDKLLYLQTKSKGTNTRYLTMGILKELQFLVPPITLQNEFAHFVEQTDKSKLEIQKSLDKLEILKKSLMQQYFG